MFSRDEPLEHKHLQYHKPQSIPGYWNYMLNHTLSFTKYLLLESMMRQFSIIHHIIQDEAVRPKVPSYLATYLIIWQKAFQRKTKSCRIQFPWITNGTRIIYNWQKAATACMYYKKYFLSKYEHSNVWSLVHCINI